MSKISLQRAIAGVVGGTILAAIIGMLIPIVAPFIGGILAVQIAGGDRKRSIMLGALVGLFYGLYASAALYGYSSIFGSSIVNFINITDLIISIIEGAIAGLISYKFFRRNSEQLADTPLPSFQALWKSRATKIVVVIALVIVAILATLLYLGTIKSYTITKQFLSVKQIDQTLGGSWTTTQQPQSYGYDENGQYYSSGLEAQYEYKNAIIVVQIGNYSNTTNAISFYSNETALAGSFYPNLTKEYSYNGTEPTFAYSFYNGTYIPICFTQNCINLKKISEIIASAGKYVIIITVSNYSMSLNQAKQLSSIQFSVLNASTTTISSSVSTTTLSTTYSATLIPNPAAGESPGSEIYIPNGSNVTGAGTITLSKIPLGSVVCLEGLPASGYTFAGYTGFPNDTQAGGACGPNYGFIITANVSGYVNWDSQK